MKNHKPIIKVPLNSSSTNPKKETKEKKLNDLKKLIKSQYNEIISYQDEEITDKNMHDIEDLILATEDLIGNCMDDNLYLGNKDQYFVNLIFICHKLSLRIETYKIEEKINKLNDKNDIINVNQKILEEKQNKSEEANNNLVYNLLGFLTAFSIVSAVVGVVGTIDGTLNIMMFMAFTILILLTTLIGLHNFYKNNNKRQTKLQDNYFLWRVMAAIVVVLFVGIAISNNKDKLYEQKEIKEKINN